MTHSLSVSRRRKRWCKFVLIFSFKHHQWEVDAVFFLSSMSPINLKYSGACRQMTLISFINNRLCIIENIFHPRRSQLLPIFFVPNRTSFTGPPDELSISEFSRCMADLEWRWKSFDSPTFQVNRQWRGPRRGNGSRRDTYREGKLAFESNLLNSFKPQSILASDWASLDVSFVLKLHPVRFNERGKWSRTLQMRMNSDTNDEDREDSKRLVLPMKQVCSDGELSALAVVFRVYAFLQSITQLLYILLGGDKKNSFELDYWSLLKRNRRCIMLDKWKPFRFFPLSCRLFTLYVDSSSTDYPVDTKTDHCDDYFPREKEGRHDSEYDFDQWWSLYWTRIWSSSTNNSRFISSDPGRRPEEGTYEQRRWPLSKVKEFEELACESSSLVPVVDLVHSLPTGVLGEWQGKREMEDGIERASVRHSADECHAWSVSSVEEVWWRVVLYRSSVAAVPVHCVIQGFADEAMFEEVVQRKCVQRVWHRRRETSMWREWMPLAHRRVEIDGRSDQDECQRKKARRRDIGHDHCWSSRENIARVAGSRRKLSRTLLRCFCGAQRTTERMWKPESL